MKNRVYVDAVTADGHVLQTRQLEVFLDDDGRICTSDDSAQPVVQNAVLHHVRVRAVSGRLLAVVPCLGRGTRLARGDHLKYLWPDHHMIAILPNWPEAW